MNIHSWPSPLPAAPSHRLATPNARTSATRSCAPPSTPSPARGFFNAQVADVARAAGVAAGTVYLYFRGKDDLLVSIFERTMKEAIADGRGSVAGSPTRPSGCGRSRGCTSAAWAATAASPSCSRSSCASRPSSWSGSRRRSCASTSASSATSSPTGRRPGRSEPTSTRRSPRSCSSAGSTRWPPTGSSAAASTRSRRRSRRDRRPVRRRRAVSVCVSERQTTFMQIRSVAVLGAGTMGAQIAAHFANAGLPVLLLDVTRDGRARRARARRGAEARSVLHPGRRSAGPHRRLRRGPRRDRRLGLDHRSDRRAARRQAGAARARRRSTARRRDRQLEHVRHPDRVARRGPVATSSARHWLGTHFFNPPRYLHLLELIPTPDTDPAVVETRQRGSPTPARQGRGRSRRTRRTSSPTASASTA